MLTDLFFRLCKRIVSKFNLVHTRKYSYSSLVRNTGSVTQHLASIAIFIVIFIKLYQEEYSINSLILHSHLICTVGYFIYYFLLDTRHKRYSLRQTLKASGLFLLTLLGMSPILKTLTEDTSSDTIWAMSVLLFGGNIAFHDYSSMNRSAQFQGTISLNAAIFASVLLASRLKSNLFVYGLMSFAIILFALFPLFRKYFRVCFFYFRIIRRSGYQ